MLLSCSNYTHTLAIIRDLIAGAQSRSTNMIEHRQKARLAALTLISVLSFPRSMAMGQTTRTDRAANVDRGLKAREGMLTIFRKKDQTVVERTIQKPPVPVSGILS